MKKTIFAALLATAGMAHAQDFAPAPAPVPSPTRFLVGMGVSGSGDDLATAQYDNGDNVTLHAGRMLYFTAGVDHHFTPEFSLQGTVNYHVDRAPGKNGSMKFERFPIEVIGYYQPNPAWRVGGGLRYTTSPKLSSDGVLSGMNISFDNTTSAVVEAEYFVRPKIGIKLRYVHETFKARGYLDVDGSHTGLSVNYYF